MRLLTAADYKAALDRTSALGNCYEAAGKYIMGSRGRDHGLRLVHGEVAGQGPLEGKTFGHAWDEDGNKVIDTSNGRHIVMPKAVYYALGQIAEIHNLKVYTWKQAQKNILKHGHWGPWDLKTRSGL